MTTALVPISHYHGYDLLAMYLYHITMVDYYVSQELIIERLKGGNNV